MNMFSSDRDAYYLISGKALFVASAFERDLKIISNFGVLLETALLKKDESRINEVWYKYIEKQALKTSANKFLEMTEFKEIFENAITSRNLVAHELTLGIENMDTDYDSIQKFIAEIIEPNLRHILTAHYYIIGVLNKMNKAETPIMNIWITERMNWAMAIQD